MAKDVRRKAAVVVTAMSATARKNKKLKEDPAQVEYTASPLA